MGKKAKPPAEIWTRERCFITELVNDEGQDEVSIARARVEPGVTTELHALSVTEWYVIESGQGLMLVGEGPPFAVGPGDSVSVPQRATQQITNPGGEDLVFLCVCVPRYTVDCYTSLE